MGNLTLVRLAILFALGFLVAMAVDGGNSFSGYWANFWLAANCAQMSRGR